MQIDPRIYNRPMTEEEKRLMIIQWLRQNNMNMMMADNNTTMPESEFPADYTTGPTVIPPGADMSQYNDVTGSMLAPPMDSFLAPPMERAAPIPPVDSLLAPPVDSTAPIMTQQEQISPMGTPMTPEQIDEEIMRLQMLKNQMMMGN